MADADFGYVGGAPGKIDLYVGKEVVKRGIPNEQACDELVQLIKDHGCAASSLACVALRVACCVRFSCCCFAMMQFIKDHGCALRAAEGAAGLAARCA